MGAFYDRFKGGKTAPTSGDSFVAQRFKQIQEQQKQEKLKESVRPTSRAIASGQYADPALAALKSAGLYTKEQRAKPPAREGFVARGIGGAQALRTGEIGVRDVAREVWPSTKQVTFKVLDTIFPGVRPAVGQTFGMFGEAAAYAIDKNVRQQYEQGNLDILPIVSNLRQRDVLRNTLVSGINATIYGRIPALAQMSKAGRLTQGALEGIGFAVADGLAEGTPAEEMPRKMVEYGVPGAIITLIAPQLVPLLSTELKNIPKPILNFFKKEGPKGPPGPKGPGGPPGTRIPVQRVGEEVSSVDFANRYVPESELPVIDAGPGAPSKGLPIIQAEARPTTDLGGGYKVVPEKPATTQPATPVAQAVPEGRTVEVPQEQLPVGEGAQKASTLEARMTGTLNRVSEANLDEAATATYRVMNRADQKAAAAKFVADDPEGAMDVLLGNRPPPTGLLNESILLALSESAESAADRALAVRLASLRATRYGQEIAFLAEAQEGSVIATITDVIKARTERALRGKGPTTSKQLVAKEGETFKRALRDTQIKDVNKIIQSIEC